MILLKSFVRVTLAGCFVLPAFLFAQDAVGLYPSRQYRTAAFFRNEKHGSYVFGDLETIKSRYTLTEFQLEEIARINLKYKKQHEKWLRKLSPTHVELELLLIEQNPDLKKIRHLLMEIGRYTSEIRLNQISHRLAIEKVVNVEHMKKKSQKPTEETLKDQGDALGFPLNLIIPERIVLPIPGILQ
nr:hypothetical protein [Leptospira perolatii]